MGRPQPPRDRDEARGHLEAAGAHPQQPVLGEQRPRLSQQLGPLAQAVVVDHRGAVQAGPEPLQPPRGRAQATHATQHHEGERAPGPAGQQLPLLAAQHDHAGDAHQQAHHQRGARPAGQHRHRHQGHQAEPQRARQAVRIVGQAAQERGSEQQQHGAPLIGIPHGSRGPPRLLGSHGAHDRQRDGRAQRGGQQAVQRARIPVGEDGVDQRRERGDHAQAVQREPGLVQGAHRDHAEGGDRHHAQQGGQHWMPPKRGPPGHEHMGDPQAQAAGHGQLGEGQGQARDLRAHGAHAVEEHGQEHAGHQGVGAGDPHPRARRSGPQREAREGVRHHRQPHRQPHQRRQPGPRLQGRPERVAHRLAAWSCSGVSE